MSSPLFSRTIPHIPRFRKVLIRTIQSLTALHIFETDILDIRLCSGASMLPTLSYDGDWVLVSPLPYTLSWLTTSRTESQKRQRGIKRGDIVFCDSVRDPQYTISKRVLGVEGDIIEVDPRRPDSSGWEKSWIADRDTVVPDSKTEFAVSRWMDGAEEKVERSTDSEGRRLTLNKRKEGFVKVPKGHIWIVGDNLSNSTDSRTYGPVPVALVKGRVIARIAPNFKWLSNNVEMLGDSPEPSHS